MAVKQAKKYIPKQTKKYPVVFVFACLLGIISLFVYANTLRNGFVLDDKVVISDNIIVTKGISAIPEIFTTPYHKGWYLADHDNLYRPLSLAVFAIVYHFWGLDPAPYHLINILLFAGCVIMLFLFFDNFFDLKKTAIAFIASLLFALHPIHTEVVANIKSCDELLCFFFAFLSLNVFIKYMRSGLLHQLIIGSFCFLLSLFAKETTITFLAVIPLLFFYYRNENKNRAVLIISSITGAAIIFLLIRFAVLNHDQAGNMIDNGLIENALTNKSLNFESRAATAVLILGYYIKLLFVPYPLISDYSYHSIPYAHFSDLLVLLSLACYIFLTAFSMWRLIKNNKDPFSFAVLYFLITISIFSNILFLIGDTMAERFMFFPSVSFCLVIALLIEKLFVKATDTPYVFLKNIKVIGIIIPISLIYVSITINRNKDWTDDYTLSKTDLGKAPDNCRLNYFVADLLLDKDPDADTTIQKENIEKTLRCLYKAIAIYPQYYLAENDLGLIYFRHSQFDSAEIHYKRGLEVKPREIHLNRNLALLYFETKKYPQSIEFNKIALEIDPDNAAICANIGLTYLNFGKYDSAIYFSNRGVSIDRKFYGSYEILASAYKALGNEDSLKKYEAIARVNNQGFNP